MSSVEKPDWWSWLELDKPVYEPMRLKDDAPEEMIRKFEEWQKKKDDELAREIYR